MLKKHLVVVLNVGLCIYVWFNHLYVPVVAH